MTLKLRKLIVAGMAAAAFSLSTAAIADGNGNGNGNGFDKVFKQDINWVHDYSGNQNNTNVIDNGAFGGFHGNLGINQAAGTGNQQANIADLCCESGDKVKVKQKLRDVKSEGHYNNNHNIISLGAFTGAKGNMGINQASGVGNQQTNVLRISKQNNGHNGPPPPYQPPQ